MWFLLQNFPLLHPGQPLEDLFRIFAERNGELELEGKKDEGPPDSPEPLPNPFL